MRSDEPPTDLPGGWLLDLVIARLAEGELDELDRPHLVVSRDLMSGLVVYDGPYPDAMTALVAADERQRADQEVGSGDPFEYSVAPLLPPALDKAPG